MPSFSEACERNKIPILEVLKDAYSHRTNVLEIGSGTGQHAVHFARHLQHLMWHPSELAEYIPDLAERLAVEGSENIAEPLELNVGNHPWLDDSLRCRVDGVFTANTLHIMSWQDVEQFFAGVGAVLDRTGTLCIYGPFRYRGRYTSESNAIFDRFLKHRDPLSGIRDFEDLSTLAENQGLRLCDDHVMPANNQLLIWVK